MQHVRGYATAFSAREDISRLQEYLKSGHNIATFKRYIPDEMDELLAPSAKRSCTRELNESRKQPTIKVMNGCVFILLRRKLNLKYHKYKKELIAEEAPTLSKEEWLQKQEEMRTIPNFGDMEQNFRCQTALNYINQRLRVVQGRKLKNVVLMDALRHCTHRGLCFTKIRDALVEEKNDIIDLTKNGPKYTEETTTSAQMNRVTVQCITVLSMLQQLDQRNDSETAILENQSHLASLIVNLCSRSMRQ